MIREDFLHQNSFHEVDTFSSVGKQYMLMKLILDFYKGGQRALAEKADFNKVAYGPLREDIGRFKYVEEKDIEAAFKEIESKIDANTDNLIKEAGELDD